MPSRTRITPQDHATYWPELLDWLGTSRHSVPDREGKRIGIMSDLLSGGILSHIIVEVFDSGDVPRCEDARRQTAREWPTARNERYAYHEREGPEPDGSVICDVSVRDLPFLVTTVFSTPVTDPEGECV